MGLSEKLQVVDGGFETTSSDNNKKWVMAGMALGAPLKPIYTIPAAEKVKDDDVETEECLTTPTGEETRIPTPSTCPPAPRKPKPKPKLKPSSSSSSSFKCNYTKFFTTPPDLETVFMC